MDRFGHFCQTEQMPDITLTQGKRIRYAREAAGLEQEELAELLHISRPALSAWERDKNKRGVSFNDLEAIARHTGMPLEFFLGEVLQFSAVTGTDIGRYDDQLSLFGAFDLVTADSPWHPSLVAA